MASHTKENFLKNATKTHGERYDYSLVEYINIKTKVKIICKQHGVFEQKPKLHVVGSGCIKCAKESFIKIKSVTAQEYIERFKKTHSDMYDYSLIDIENLVGKKVSILCKNHGEFKQCPKAHSNGSHCPKCAILTIRTKTTKTNDDFVRQAGEIHKNKYDYSLVDYKNSYTKISIICPVHGKFEQNPRSHLNNHGCRDCGINSRTEAVTTKKEDYITACKKAHYDFYDYSKVKYTKGDEKITVICPTHGEFNIRANSHFQGQGCSKCSNNNKDIGFYSLKRAERHKKEWIEKPCYLYYIQIITEKEVFYKIGITIKTLKDRFKTDNFKFNKIKLISSNLYNCVLIEQEIIKENKHLKHKSIFEKFNGYTECFSENILHKIEEKLLDYKIL